MYLVSFLPRGQSQLDFAITHSTHNPTQPNPPMGWVLGPILQPIVGYGLGPITQPEPI
jgi:hypothetical protein